MLLTVALRAVAEAPPARYEPTLLPSFIEREAEMRKLLIITGLALSVGVGGAAGAQTKMSFGACKTKVMQDGRNLDGNNRNYCGRGCMAKVRACQRGAG